MSDESLGAQKIEELQDKYRKEPSSKVFLQLAEEYRRAGRFNEAIEVCLDGLKRNPSYSTARMTLARAFMGAKRYDEAKAEFERIIAAVPDNILANRYLGDIFYEEGRGPDALKRYKIVAMLNPHDEEVTSRLQRLQSGLAPETRPPLAGAPARPAPSAAAAASTAAPPPVRAASAPPHAAAAMPVRPVPTVPIEAPPSVDEEAFMDLKIDESMILNADMINAAMSGSTEIIERPVLTRPPASPAVPAAAAPRPAPAAPPAPAVPAAIPGEALELGGDDFGEMMGEDFAEFSSPTVMLSAADLMKIPGVADYDPKAVSAVSAPTGVQAIAADEPPPPPTPVRPVAPPPAPVVAAAPPASSLPPPPAAAPAEASSFASRTKQKFGIGRYEGPPAQPPSAASAAPVMAPPPAPAAPASAATAPRPAMPTAPPPPAIAARSAPTVSASTPEPERLESEDVGEMGMDDFSEFAAPTVMMNVADLLKSGALGPGGLGPDDEVAEAAAPAPPSVAAEVEAGDAEMASQAAAMDLAPMSLLDESAHAPALFDEAPSFEPAPFETPVFEPAPFDAPPADEPSVFEGLSSPEPTMPAEVFGTMAIPVDEVRALRKAYAESQSQAQAHPPAPAPVPAPVPAPTPALEEVEEAMPALQREADGLASLEAAAGSFAPPGDADAFAPPTWDSGALMQSPPLAAEAWERTPLSAPAAAADGASRTIGELYLQQGHLEKALHVFEQLAAGEPGDRAMRQRVEEVRARITQRSQAAAPAQAPAPAAMPAPRVVPAPAVPAAAAAVAASAADTGGGAEEDKKKKVLKLSNWLASLKK